MSDRVLVALLGAGLGAVTELDGGSRRIVWDQRVKSLPRPVADRLLRATRFAEAIAHADAARRSGVPLERLAELVAADAVTAASYVPAEGAEVPVVILDDRTRRALAAEPASPVRSPQQEGAVP